MGICKFKGGDRKQKYNEKVALNRASQPWSQKETTHKGTHSGIKIQAFLR